MKTYRLALIGFGNVGQGLVQIIRDNQTFYAEKLGVAFSIVAVSDMLKGCVFYSGGIAASLLLDTVEKEGSLRSLSQYARDWDALETIRSSGADIVVEMTYTDLETGQPATNHIEAALRLKKHVVTTNKGPVALKYAELAELAAQNNVTLGIEGTVMSGTPSIRLGMENLKAARIQRVQGILNGTTNYILTQMEAGASYADALKEAQEKGYAEADPSGDVDGHDAAGKVAILANLIFDTHLLPKDVDRQGISSITTQEIHQAQGQSCRWKLIGSLEAQASGLIASVSPQLVPYSHPLAHVNGATNAITFSTQLLGDVTLIGPGAGRLATGYAIIEDIMAVHNKSQMV